MGPRTSGLRVRITEAEEVVERLLVERLFAELDRLGEEVSPTDIPVAVWRRIGRSFSEIQKQKQEATREDYLYVYAGLAPDLLQIVTKRLRWGPAELASLNLTESFAWRADRKRSEVGRLLVKLHAAVASHYLELPTTDGNNEAMKNEEGASPTRSIDQVSERELPSCLPKK